MFVRTVRRTCVQFDQLSFCCFVLFGVLFVEGFNRQVTVVLMERYFMF